MTQCNSQLVATPPCMGIGKLGKDMILVLEFSDEFVTIMDELEVLF